MNDKWCPVMEMEFDSNICPLFEGEKCKDIDPIKCINLMEGKDNV